MINRLVIYCKDELTAERAAAEAAELLGWFYLSFTGLILYNGNRLSLAELVKEGTYNKYFKRSAADAAEYENTVIATGDEDAVAALAASGAAVGIITENGVKPIEKTQLNGCSAFFTVNSTEEIASALGALYGGYNG